LVVALTRKHGTRQQGKGAYSPFVWYLAQSIREPDVERGLHDGGGDGDAIHGPQGADEVDCGRTDGVIWNKLVSNPHCPCSPLGPLSCVVKRGQESEQDARVHDPLAQVRREDVHVVLPRRVLKAQGRHQRVAHHHERGTDPDKRDQLAPSRHHNTGDQAADRRRQGWNRQPGACGSGRVEQDDLEEQREIEQVL
jgi:hypothetical protein